MKVNFAGTETSQEAVAPTTGSNSPWEIFYTDADVKILGGSTTRAEWVDIEDPFKPGEKGGFSKSTGLLHLWSQGSQEQAVDELRKYGIEKRVRHGSDDFIFTPVEFLMLRYEFEHMDAVKAVDEFREKFATSKYTSFGNKDNDFTKDVPKIQPKDVEMLLQAQERFKSDIGRDADLTRSYCIEKGINYETLVEFGVGIRFDVGNDQGNDQLLIPYYMNGKLMGIRVRGWSYKRAVTGTAMTLFGLQQFENTDSKTVIIVEGETDAFVMKQLVKENGFGEVPVVAIPTNHFKDEWKRLLQQFSRIIAVPQTDYASTKFQENVSRIFGDKLEVVEIPFRQYDIGKDISHFVTRSEGAKDRLFLTMGLSKKIHTEYPRIETLGSLYSSEVDQRPFLIQEILPKGSLVILAGPPKSGKTFIALEMSLSMIKGEKLFGMDEFPVIEPGKKVLYVVEENSRYALINRFKKMGFTEEMEENFFLMHMQNVRLDDKESVNQLRRDVNQIQPDLIVLDPFANLHSQDENSSTGVQKVLQSVTRMMKFLPDSTFMIVHHTGKNGEVPRIRGSSAIWGRADLQLLVMPVEEDRASEVRLKVSGREVNPDTIDTIDLKLDSDNLHHYKSQEALVLPSDPKVNFKLKKDRTNEKLALTAAMKENPNHEWTLNELAAATNLGWYEVTSTVEEMFQDGSIDLMRGGKGKPQRHKLIQGEEA